jgi:hypothetical protein
LQQGFKISLIIFFFCCVFNGIGFSSWIPEKLMYVGQGGYGSKNANGHLKWIAEKEFELIDSGLTDLGSTWYGQSEVMMATARYIKIG